MTGDADRELQRKVGEYRRDALGFVAFAFPWGKAGTPLEGETGPETWQREVLQQLGQGLCAPEEATRIAVASGHGIGKSALVAWSYGEDSDFVRVRVKGVFPCAGSMQFIDSQRIGDAATRPLEQDPTAPLVMGVDIARHGEDQTVIRFRRGLDARSVPAIKFRVPDLMRVASSIMELYVGHNPDAVFVDATGIGWGVLDRLRQLGCSRAIGIDFGGGADRTDMGDAAARYANKRAEMWGFMKEWLRFGCIPNDAELIADLGNLEYGYNAADALVLERKDDMRRRGLASPDDGDALALTFARRVAKIDDRQERRLEDAINRLKRAIV